MKTPDRENSVIACSKSRFFPVFNKEIAFYQFCLQYGSVRFTFNVIGIF